MEDEDIAGLGHRQRARSAREAVASVPPPRRRAHAATIALTEVLPEVAASLTEDDPLAGERLRLLRADGELAELFVEQPTAFDFIVADGIVLKRTRFGGRSALELLGPGDVLAPPLTPVRQLESRAVSSYAAHGQASLAVIDGHFRAVARRWPELSDVLLDRLARQTHRASMHLAMLHIARAEDRVLALFSDLAERFGRVTTDGIIIDIELTHGLIGQLVGSRRPTVSLALEEHSSIGTLTRTRDGRWRLASAAVLQRSSQARRS